MKVKLEHYREYVRALSGVARSRVTPEAHARYADAVNSLPLIGSAEVLRALNDFQAEISPTNQSRTVKKHDTCLNTLFRSMRRDVQPVHAADDVPFFRLVDVPRDN